MESEHKVECRKCEEKVDDNFDALYDHVMDYHADEVCCKDQILDFIEEEFEEIY